MNENERKEAKAETLPATIALYARQLFTKAEGKGEMKRAKLYLLTREIRNFVWLRWEGYSTQKRGLSMKISRQQLKEDWMRCPKADAFDPQYYFRKHKPEPERKKKP